jgi:hypothetical protein
VRRAPRNPRQPRPAAAPPAHDRDHASGSRRRCIRRSTAATRLPAGDSASARTDYEQGAADEPGNRDALLGLAALECAPGASRRRGDYLRLLQADPRDSQAQARLIALRAGASSPLAPRAA